MSHKRADRVGDLIQAELARLLLRDVADPRIRNVTITDVTVTDDLRLARVYYVRLGEEGYAEEVVSGLQRATGFFRRELGKNLNLRYVPNLEFFFDDSFDYGSRIERILSAMHEVDPSDDAGNNS